MQERSIARKARSAGQKAAKVEARRSVQRGVVPGLDVLSNKDEAVFGVISPKQPQSPKSISSAEEMEETKSALVRAIEAGDWKAVSDAAVLLSDASVASASTGEIDKLQDISMSTYASARTSGSIEEQRAAEIDALVEKADWNGVVEATKRFAEADKQPKRTKEEEEALKQAEVWMKIAEQNKATDAAASQAAEWAIQRSLSQLKEAEKSNSPPRNTEGDEEV
jgi:hypothetical protein